MTGWKNRAGREMLAVALDIDGTLAGVDHRVSERTATTILQLAARGVVPIIVTGRTERAAQRLSDRMELSAPIISCNGAVVTDPASKEHLRMVRLDSAVVSRIVAFGQERNLGVIVWTTTGMITDRRDEGADLLEEVNQEPVTVSGLGPAVCSDAVKVMLSGSPPALDAVQAEVRAAIPIMERSMDQFYESSNPGATKREALRQVLDIIGVSADQCLGIADGDTDAGWLSDMGVAVAVSNARASVKNVAHLHIGHHGDESVASFLETHFDLEAGSSR